MSSRKGFTLIELLVVISIIALLISILLPALRNAREVAKNVQCLSNVRSVATAMLSYEGDEGRLTVHLYEFQQNATAPEQLSRNTGNPKDDLRPLYSKYIGSVNFFSCPFQAAWDKEIDAIPMATKRLYVDYCLFPGYFCDFDGTNYSDPTYRQNQGKGVWTRSGDIWLYDGYKMSVLASDRISNEVGRYYRFNHPIKGGGVAVGQDIAPPTATWAASQYWVRAGTTSVDARTLTDANYAYTDGHAATFPGNDPKLIEITGPRLDATYNFLAPHD
ncbi:MAG: prepilin-type N-terminal cleavage/methylation domain-containing protein [Phycisphaeraceae bacterium]|nr:prepilin-type N-terminal cleavage/methylation domain-containing protein [Phycisphaeraceae bacterium]